MRRPPIRPEVERALLLCENVLPHTNRHVWHRFIRTEESKPGALLAGFRKFVFECEQCRAPRTYGGWGGGWSGE